MPAGSRAALVLVLALLLPVGAALAGSPGDAGQAQVSPPQTNASTTILVQIQSDGDARWTISTSFNLTTDNETAAFRELASEFESGQTSALGLDAYRQASEQASQATGREMAIENVEKTASPESVIQNGTSRLILSFTWTNFGRVEGDQIQVDDVFETPDGPWFPGLEPDQTLVVRAPDRYSVFDANVAPQNGTLRWTGPESFGPETLDVTFTGTGPTTTPTPTQPSGSGLAVWILVGVAGVAGGAFVVYLITRRDGELDSLPTPFPTDDETEATAPGDEESAEEPAEELDEEAGGEELPEETAAGAAGKPATESDDEELLSDEERVERLLRDNGGRMKQANIVKETDWSNAKVSQLLSAMEEEGQIDKLRIGRENLISFPDEDITDFED